MLKLVELEDKLEIEKREDPKKDTGQFVAGLGKPSSGKSRLLQHLNTRISVGTEVLLKKYIILTI